MRTSSLRREIIECSERTNQFDTETGACRCRRNNATPRNTPTKFWKFIWCSLPGIVMRLYGDCIVHSTPRPICCICMLYIYMAMCLWVKLMTEFRTSFACSDKLAKICSRSHTLYIFVLCLHCGASKTARTTSTMPSLASNLMACNFEVVCTIYV